MFRRKRWNFIIILNVKIQLLFNFLFNSNMRIFSFNVTKFFYIINLFLNSVKCLRNFSQCSHFLSCQRRKKILMPGIIFFKSRSFRSLHWSPHRLTCMAIKLLVLWQDVSWYGTLFNHIPPIGTPRFRRFINTLKSNSVFFGFNSMPNFPMVCPISRFLFATLPTYLNKWSVSCF